MMEQWRELTPETPDGLGTIKSIVCAYCQNRLRQRCVDECAPEGLYRNLEPKEMHPFDHLPSLPRMAKLMEYGFVTRFALMYLVLHYLQSMEE